MVTILTTVDHKDQPEFTITYSEETWSTFVPDDVVSSSDKFDIHYVDNCGTSEINPYTTILDMVTSTGRQVSEVNESYNATNLPDMSQSLINEERPLLLDGDT